MKSLVEDNGISALPALVFYNRRKAVVYQGYHAMEPVLEFINKQIGESVTKLKSVSDVENFIELRSARKYSLSTVHVVCNAVCRCIFMYFNNNLFFKIGFFSEHEDVEEDDYEDFIDTSKALQVIITCFDHTTNICEYDFLFGLV